MMKLNLTKGIALAMLGLVLGSSPLVANEKYMKKEEKMLDESLKKLDLNTQQKDQINGLRNEHRGAMSALMTTKKIDLDALKSRYDSKASDSALKESVSKVGDDMKACMDEERSFYEKLSDILTPQQSAKMILDKKDKED